MFLFLSNVFPFLGGNEALKSLLLGNIQVICKTQISVLDYVENVNWVMPNLNFIQFGGLS